MKLAGKGLARATQAHLARSSIDVNVVIAPASRMPAVRIARAAPDLRASIVIATRNRGAHLQRCVESVRESVRRHVAEIIVADNDFDNCRGAGMPGSL